MNVFGKLLFLCLPFSLYFEFVYSAQESLTQVEIFHRCYMRMTKSVVPTSGFGGELEQAVREGKKTATSACMELLNSAVLDAQTGKTLNSVEGPLVLKTFHHFHNTWFQGKELSILASIDETTLLVKDPDEPALYFSRALFGQLPKYNSSGVGSNIGYALTANEGLRSLRQSFDGSGVLRTNFASRFFISIEETALCLILKISPCNLTTTPISSFDIASGTASGLDPVTQMPSSTHPNMGTVNLPDVQVSSFGQIVGIDSVNPIVLPKGIIFQPSLTVGTLNTELGAHLNSTLRMPGVDLQKHYGGGILGSQMFIMKNSNLPINFINGSGDNDKDNRIHRRVAARIMNDLLCQNLPTLKEADVTPDFSSPHTFRQSVSCMQCHVSMDPMAHGYRNFGIFRTANNEQVSATVNEAAVRKGNSILGVAQIPIKAGTKVFAMQDPEGVMTYRDHLGTLKTFQFHSTAELGEKLLNDGDFYRCVAKKYYTFFTGISVNLYSKPVYSNPAAPTYSEVHRKKVEDLASTLRSTRDVRVLIQEIIGSEAFRSRNYKYVEASGE